MGKMRLPLKPAVYEHAAQMINHTLAHFRNLGWYPRLLGRAYCDHTQPAPTSDEKLLQQADQAWRKLVAAEPPPEIEPAFAREVNRIVEAARKELLAG